MFRYRCRLGGWSPVVVDVEWMALLMDDKLTMMASLAVVWALVYVLTLSLPCECATGVGASCGSLPRAKVGLPNTGSWCDWAD